MSIGKVAKICEVNIDTIRYYEKMELIPKATRSNSGYRMFDQETANFIKFIKRAKQLGFSLIEIKSLISMSKSNGSDCGDIRVMASEKLEQIEEKISGLKVLKKNLNELIKACPGSGKPLNECSILDSLNEH